MSTANETAPTTDLVNSVPAAAPAPAPDQPTASPAPITLRTPSTSLDSGTSASIKPPPLSWIEQRWNVTHSTLPMWKKYRNVQITYKRLAGTSPAHLDDLVTYQPLKSSSTRTVHGVDKPFDVPGASIAEGKELASLGYNWRGKGWLIIAASKWEILGWGEEEGSGKKWVVTFFAKTLFTPAGVDIYSGESQLEPETIESIKTALAERGGDVATLAKGIFAVAMD
ncbi:hypothetical protein CC78DRAFT_517372 [Lojkania enalia]|uniref:Uncharacterized protein n=1 Tax=Lojkania enalia TaxID=147567 RepID=A0A9P4K8V5_9PLEO|nr:hypothetical protein CC78DRAFT_517372 [Didymosphaeria enalia]